MRRRVLVLALLGASAASCDRCVSCKDKVKAHISEPPIEDQRKEVEEQMPTASRQATSMCGVSVAGLRDVKVTVSQERPPRFRVEGKPIAKSDAGYDLAKISQVAICIGVMSIVAWPIVDQDNKVTGFKWDPVVLESVSTPGVNWTKPSSGGGGWD